MSTWRALGSALRSAGQALEGLGAALQGTGRETVSRHKTIQGFAQKTPSLAEGSFVAPNASLIGAVSLGKGSSIWYGAVLRADVNEITIGENTNIQDGAIVHVAKNNAAGKALPTKIGNNVTVGHGATIHAATIEDGSLVGMGATVLDGAKVEQSAIVAAGAVLTPNKTVPSGQIWAGNPAKYLRDLDADETEFILQSATNYTALAAVHSAENSKTFEEVEVDKERRQDRRERSPDYDSHLGILRDPITREIIKTSGST